MQVSVHDADFKPGRYRVYLDGEDVNDRCFAADDEEGWADCYALNEQGRKHVRPDNPNEIATERLTGTVVIVDVRARLFHEAAHEG